MLKKILLRQRRKSNSKKRKKEYVGDIISGKTDLNITDYKIANIIMQWSAEEENPVEFFSRCLHRMGIIAPVRITLPAKFPRYYEVRVRELETGLVRDFYISRNPKESLMSSIMLDDENVQYIIQGNEYKLIIKNGRITVEYWRERIRVSIDNMGNDINITLTGYEWKKEEKSLYIKAKSLIRDLQTLNTNMDSYFYYIAAKEKIKKYYNLSNVAIGFYTNFLTIHSCDGKLLIYQDSNNGITIKKFERSAYKEYSREGIKLVWKDDKFKCEGVPDKDIQKYIDIVESLIENVEKLEF